MSLEASPGAAKRRSRIPTRCVIHSSEVSTIWARSLLVTIRSGTYEPVPAMRLAGHVRVLLDISRMHPHDSGPNPARWNVSIAMIERPREWPGQRRVICLGQLLLAGIGRRRWVGRVTRALVNNRLALVVPAGGAYSMRYHRG